MSDRAFVRLLQLVWLAVLAVTLLECMAGRILPADAIAVTGLRLLGATVLTTVLGWVLNLTNPGANLH